MSDQHAVECVGVSRTYRTGAREVQAVRGVDLTVDAGSWVALMGPSGSGKSTLLQMIGGLDTPDAGTISVAGRRIDGLSETARALLRRRSIGYVFQFFNLIANQSVAENVELPLLLAGASRREARGRATELLERLGLGDTGRAAATDLSGGQQQRVAIARAVANHPAVLLADEPTGNLDTTSAAEVLALLDEQHREGQTIVMVTHDAKVAAHADRLVVMTDGRIVSDEPTRATVPRPDRSGRES